MHGNDGLAVPGRGPARRDRAEIGLGIRVRCERLGLELFELVCPDTGPLLLRVKLALGVVEEAQVGIRHGTRRGDQVGIDARELGEVGSTLESSGEFVRSLDFETREPATVVETRVARSRGMRLAAKECGDALREDEWSVAERDRLQ